MVQSVLTWYIGEQRSLNLGKMFSGGTLGNVSYEV